MNNNAGLWSQRQVVEAKAGELRKAQSGGEAPMQHCTISDARPVNWPRSVKQGLNLILAEVPQIVNPSSSWVSRGSVESAQEPTEAGIP